MGSSGFVVGNVGPRTCQGRLKGACWRQAAPRVASETGFGLSVPPFPSYEIGCFRTARSGQGRAEFARRSEPLTARTVLEESRRRERGSGLPTTNPEYPRIIYEVVASA